MAETELCNGCKQLKIQKCLDCETSFCTKCEDKEHVNKCKCYEVSNSVKSARDLVEGKVVLRELPLVVAPTESESGNLPCVGCCRLSSEKISQCPECFWPACKPDCEGLKDVCGHGIECKILKLQKTNHIENFRFDLLLPLRILLLQITNETKWNCLLSLNIKSDPERNFLGYRKEIIDFLFENFMEEYLKLEECENMTILKENSRETLLNIFTQIRAVKYETDAICADIVYPTINFFEHSCMPNSSYTVGDGYEITVRTNSTISKDAIITISYTDLLLGTHERLTDLKKNNITCCCARCSDNSEFDTMFSALKCLGDKSETCGGNQLPISPTSEDTLWVCDNCKMELPNDQMIKFIQHLGHEVRKVCNKVLSTNDLEEFLAKLLMFLHPNHFYVCRIKWKLIKLYGDDLAAIKVELVNNLYEIVSKFYPNKESFLGELMFELCKAKFVLLQAKEEKCQKEVDEISELIQKAKTYSSFCPFLLQNILDEEAKLCDWLKKCQ